LTSPYRIAGADLAALLHAAQGTADCDLAARYAPVILFDSREPFLPLVAGFTIFRSDADSPSFRRRIALAPAGKPAAALAIEYAIWWDWDIGHLYELEHVWVYVDGAGQVVRVEASWHGELHDMADDAALALAGDHPTLFSEPGKHAFAPDPAWFCRRRSPSEALFQTTRWAGAGGVLVTSLFERELRPARTPFANTLVRSYLSQRAFEPAREFTQRVALTAEMLAPWPAVRGWIPERVTWWIEKLKAEIKPAEMRFLRIAHRGASAHAPDNTLAAFRKAAALGADMVELDVQVAADGAAVVIHDLVVDWPIGGRGAVSDLTAAELKAFTIKGRGGADDERIPTLDEAIECCTAEGLGMYIELKAAGAAPRVVAAVRRHDVCDWVIVGSFRPDWGAGVKLLDARIATSVLFSAPNVDPVKLAQAVAADYVHPCWERLDPEPHKLLTVDWISRVRQAGLGIILWHEERLAEIAALRKLGVDGICSNAPELL